MTEDRIKSLIQDYVCAEMEIVPDPEKIPEHPPYSRKFNKKMKRIIRAGDYFGGNLRLYTVLSRVAAVILIVLSLAVANQASAAIFGFDPWKEVITGFLPDVKMEEKRYKKKDIDADNLIKPISDVPTYVPEGYVQISRQEASFSINLEWNKVESDGTMTYLSYGRDVLDEDAVYIEDVEYDRIDTTEIAGYTARICYKPNRVLIEWEDEEFHYMIWTGKEKMEISTLKRMSESIYKKIIKN